MTKIVAIRTERMTQDIFYSPDRPLGGLARDYRHGDRVPLHSHERAQLLHAVSGVVTVVTGAGSWVVPPFRAVWLPAGMPHETRMSGAVRMRTVFVDPGSRPDFPKQCVVVDVSPLLRELLIVAGSLPLDYPLGGREERIMELILDEIRTLPILSLHIPMPRDRALAALCRGVMERPERPVSLEGFAAATGVSARTISRMFQRETAMSFGQWMRRARLLASMDALAAGVPVVDVALSLGYESPSAFSAMFRKMLGVSPSLYFARSKAGRDHSAA